MSNLPAIAWITVTAVVGLVSFVAGVAVGRGFWRDVRWIKSRR